MGLQGQGSLPSYRPLLRRVLKAAISLQAPSLKLLQFGTAGQIFATIAYQLAFAFPCLKQIIEELVEDDPSIVNNSLDLQLFSQLILESMQLVKQPQSKVVIIDGLDECEGKDSDI